MKIAILSQAPKQYSTKRLKQAAIARGHQVKVQGTLSFSIVVDEHGPELYFRGKRLAHLDGVIPRIGASITFYGTAVVRQLEQMGVFTLNSSHAISVSRDKLRSFQILSRHNLGLPPTVFVRDREGVMEAVDQVGGPPVIIKILEGTQGVGVILAESAKTAKAIVETLQLASQNVIIQKFIGESRGRDIRAFVVGGRVVAAMRRVAQPGEYRSNVHQGGSVEAVQLDEEFEQTAIRSAQILGLQVAGVDMLEGADGPMIMEVNSSPGLEGIERATGVDVADAVIAHMEDRVLFPEVDLRQRLTHKAGYGVVELPITPRSELAGSTLSESGLRQREILVLSIQRSSVTIPSPTGNERLLRGDVLLCFGKLITLKALIPPPKRRRSRRTKTKRPAPSSAPPETAEELADATPEDSSEAPSDAAEHDGPPQEAAAEERPDGVAVATDSGREEGST